MREHILRKYAPRADLLLRSAAAARRKACAARLTTRLVLPLITWPPVIFAQTEPGGEVLDRGEALQVRADLEDNCQRSGGVYAIDAREVHAAHPNSGVRRTNLGAAARRTIQPMQHTTGIVVDGRIVIEGESLPDGTVVTTPARESDETFIVPPELEAELLESIAEAERGEFIAADELLQRLRRDA